MNIFEGLYGTVPVSPIFKNYFFSHILSIAQNNNSMGLKVIHTLIPSILLLIPHTVSDIEPILVSMLFVAFTKVSDESKSPFLKLLMPVLCKLFSRSLESPPSQYVAVALTHIARTYPDILRDAISGTDESDRHLLQRAMMSALQKQQLVEQQQINSSVPVSLPKKIDVMKFRK